MGGLELPGINYRRSSLYLLNRMHSSSKGAPHPKFKTAPLCTQKWAPKLSASRTVSSETCPRPEKLSASWKQINPQERTQPHSRSNKKQAQQETKQREQLSAQKRRKTPGNEETNKHWKPWKSGAMARETTTRPYAEPAGSGPKIGSAPRPGSDARLRSSDPRLGWAEPKNILLLEEEKTLNPLTLWRPD